MNYKELSESELSEIIENCRAEIQRRIDSMENVIAKDDIQEYKSLYARLTMFYDFSRCVYSVLESELKDKFGNRKTKVVRNALINFLLDNGFSHADIQEEFNLARTSVNSKRTYHYKNYKNNKLYTEIFDEVSGFFDN